MKLRALNNTLIIRKQQPSTKTPGGLHIPDSATPGVARGEVLDAGPGAWVDGGFRPTGVNVGDVVVFQRHAGFELDASGEKLAVLDVAQVLAVEVP